MLFNLFKYKKNHFLFILCSLIYTVPSLAVNYKLGPGDTINIGVYNESDLQVRARIDKSGLIGFPFIGDIQVIGLTTKEVAKIIDDGLRGNYLIEPQVSVLIDDYRPFYINGLVSRPGGYAYQEGLTLDKAIALSGGLASRASKSDWVITRIVDGKTLKLNANISTEIKPDDIIRIGQSFF